MTTVENIPDRPTTVHLPGRSSSTSSCRLSGNLVIAALALLILPSCSGTALLRSAADEQPITVNGDLMEWTGKMETAKGTPLSIALRDDQTFLYVALQTKDQNVIRQIMVFGLTVWFNDSADKTHQVGIRFPIGRSPTTGRRTEGRSPTVPTDRFARFEIINADGDAREEPVGAIRGLMTGIVTEFGSFMYELKIPLRADGGYNYAIDVPDSGLFGLGIEIGSPRRGSGPGATSAGGRGGFGSGRGAGRGGPGGRSGGRGAGSGGRDRSSAPRAIEYWARVLLSTARAEQ